MDWSVNQTGSADEDTVDDINRAVPRIRNIP